MSHYVSKVFIATGLFSLALVGTSLAGDYGTKCSTSSSTSYTSTPTSEKKTETLEQKADKIKMSYNETKSTKAKKRAVMAYKKLTGKELPTSSIVDIAVGNKSFSTLVAAVTAADLVTTLNGNGPFTVFAPTNEAFAKVDAKILATLLTKEKKADLTSILTYHVVAGNIRAKDLKDGMELTTVQGAKLKVSIAKDGTVKINNSVVTSADIEGRNGFIHVIDTVLMP